MGKLNLRKASIPNTEISHHEIPEANLEGIEAPKAQFEFNNMVGVNLSHANLEEATFFHNNATRGNFIGSNFTKTYVENSDFTEASLPIESFFKSKYWRDTHGTETAKFYLGNKRVVGLSISSEFETEHKNTTRCIVITPKNLSDNFNSDSIHILDIPRKDLVGFGIPKQGLIALAEARRTTKVQVTQATRTEAPPPNCVIE